MIKEILKSKLSLNTRKKLKKELKDIQAYVYRNNLTKLGHIYGTDKVGEHFYTEHYQTHFKKFRLKKINLFEIGVGGIKNPLKGGESLRMWKKYFPLAKIFSIDIHDKSALQEKNITIFKGNQVDKDFLEEVCNEIDEKDIVIDDGSHMNEHVIESFKILFPKLKDGGIYVVEDTQTSYWEHYGGNNKDLNNPKTMMNFFKSFTDSLNKQEFLIPNYEQTYFDKKIVSMHFYYNLIFIYKGNNNEKFNIVVGNKL